MYEIVEVTGRFFQKENGEWVIESRTLFVSPQLRQAQEIHKNIHSSDRFPYLPDGTHKYNIRCDNEYMECARKTSIYKKLSFRPERETWVKAAEALGWPTEGPFAAYLWRFCDEELLFTEAVQLMWACGYDLFSGYPLVPVGREAAMTSAEIALELESNPLCREHLEAVSVSR